ncbi:MAG: hypothetical protein WBH31_07325, partial [Promethearchaeia archaeon]
FIIIINIIMLSSIFFTSLWMISDTIFILTFSTKPHFMNWDKEHISICVYAKGALTNRVTQ